MDLLQQLHQLELIRPLDYQFARFIGAEEQNLGEPEQQQLLRLLGALTSLQLARGEVCLPLDGVRELTGEWPVAVRQQVTAIMEAVDPDRLTAYSVISDGSSEAPLVLQQGRLYLYRYFRYETGVADQIRAMAEPVKLDFNGVKQGLQQLFPESPETDWQQVAAAVAISRRFSVISGGPGTGKTTTVARLLALYTVLFSEREGRAPVIRLAAPTGKAAARLSESLGQARDRLAISDQLKTMIPDQALTLHRLLGTRPDSRNFRHNRENPLHLDLLVVDEASMIDLPMIWRLIDALPEHAQLILIGDKDQLASVEAGSVLGDICGWSGYEPSGELRYSSEQCRYLNQVTGSEMAETAISCTGISDALALLRKSYRFDQHSGIGQLAAAVNQGDGRNALQLFDADYDDISHLQLSEQGYQQVIDDMCSGYRVYLRLISEGAEPAEVLKAFNSLQLLAVIREGVYGISGLNEAIESQLHRQGLIKQQGLWYSGRPVMISRNDYQLNLFNGDIGIAMPDQEGRLRVWFELPDGEMKGVLPGRLPDHETVFAMTVHKSQGSEFDRVVMILPPEESPLLSRELIYTGITRAKKSFLLLAVNRTLVEGCDRRTERASGLGRRLWLGE